MLTDESQTLELVFFTQPYVNLSSFVHC